MTPDGGKGHALNLADGTHREGPDDLDNRPALLSWAATRSTPTNLHKPSSSRCSAGAGGSRAERPRTLPDLRSARTGRTVVAQGHEVHLGRPATHVAYLCGVPCAVRPVLERALLDPAPEGAEHFTDTLPRSVACSRTVPTYMIFDDHDVTDDWNLSGVAPGRHAVVAGPAHRHQRR